MSLLAAELRKVWGQPRVPTAAGRAGRRQPAAALDGRAPPPPTSPPAAAYRAAGADLAALGPDMAAKGEFLHGKLEETEALLRLDNYYRDLAYGNSVYLQHYREENAALFDTYEQAYLDESYTLYTGSLAQEYLLFSQLATEYDTVAGYTDFLEGVQAKATQLAGISIFQNDETGYDLKNIEVTAEVYAGLGATPDRLLPAKRAVHRHFLRLHRPDPAGFHARAGAAACAAGAGQRAVVACAQPARRAAANRVREARRVLR